MFEERVKYLQAEAYELSANRTDYANGYKPKTANTRLRTIISAISPPADIELLAGLH